MERHNPLIRIVLAAALCVLLLQAFSQDQTIAINTDNPNANAVLHLHAPNGDQGLLVPTLSAGQRESMSLDAQDNGLLVYDTDNSVFYYWRSPSWIALSITDSQRLTLDGNTLSIDNGNSVDLSAIVPTINPPIAEDVAYNADSSLLTATTVQEAIDALDQRLDLGDFTQNGAATDISFDNEFSSLQAENVQEAIDRMDDRLDELRGSQVDFNDSRVSFDAGNVQRAIEELDDAVSDALSTSEYTIDDDGNHLLGIVDGLPDGENNILVANATEAAVDPAGSYNLLLGYSARVNGSNTGGMAIGAGTFVEGNRAIAFGAEARVEGGAEDAVALGTGTVATQANTVILGDGINSPVYRVGVNVQDPATPLQVGDNLGFFHFSGTNNEGPIVGEAIANNVYPVNSELYAREVGRESSIIFLRGGGTQFFTVNPSASTTLPISLDNDVVPALFIEPDTTTIFASLRVENTVSLGAHNSGAGALPDDGTIEYNGGLKVYHESTWREVALEPSATATPSLTAIPTNGRIDNLPSDDYFPIEVVASSGVLREIKDGYPGQKLTIVNSGNNGNLLFVLDYISNTNPNNNIDLQGALTSPIDFGDGSSLQLMYDSFLGRWVEISRSINTGL